MRLVVVAVLAWSVTAKAQPAKCNKSIVDSLRPRLVLWCSADRPPEIVRITPPVYPEELAAVRVPGTVELEATVGIDGVVDTSKMRVIQSTHALFTNAARAAVGAWRFRPAESDGALVEARGRLLLQFSVAERHLIPNIPALDTARVFNGVFAKLGWRALPSAPPTHVDSADVDAVIESIVRSIGGRVDNSRGFCLDWSPTERGDPPASLLARLAAAGSPWLPPSRCPTTYASMIQQLDSLGRAPVRPPGYLDPQWLTIRDVVAWTADVFVFRVSRTVGSGGEQGRCQAARGPSNTWKVHCGELARFVW
jgi:TonB family protein